MSAAEQTPIENPETLNPENLDFLRDVDAEAEGNYAAVPEAQEPEAPAEEPTHQPETSWIDTEGGDDKSLGSRPAPRRGRGGRSRGARRGLDASTLPIAEPEEEGVFFPGPAKAEEPEEPAATPESEPAPTRTFEEEARTPEPEAPAPRRIYNKDIPDGIEQKVLSGITPEAPEPQTNNQDVIDQAIAEYNQKRNTPAVDPTERPNLSGKVQAYNVVLGPNSQSKLEHPRNRGEPAAVTPETPKAPAKAEEPAATPESEPAAASNRTSDEEVRVTQPAAPATPARRATGGDLYSQLGLAESPLTTDRDELRGASRTGLASTGVPVPSSREIRDGATPEPVATTGEATAEPSAESRRRRHRRGDPASLLQRLGGYTSARPETPSTPPNTDNEATQQLPTVTIGEATTGEAAPRLSRTQRLRARIGAIATAFGDLSENFQQNREIHQRGGDIDPNQRPGIQPGMNRAERRLEKRRQEIEADADSEQSLGVPGARFMSPEENAQHERGRGARRRRMVGALGLAAASVGLMAGISGDTPRDEAPRSSISASQLPGQQQERQESISSIFDDQAENIQDVLDRQIENLEKGDKSNSTSDTSNEQVGKAVDVGNEKITLDNDGGVTIKLEKGGNYWEGVHEAERLLDIDDSATATANAVNTIGFEKGEDRNQKVGAKVTFKNINGKLVASRS